MSESLALAIVAYGTLLASLFGVVAVSGRTRPPVLTVGLAVLQVAALIAGALDGVALMRGRHGTEVSTNLGYLVTALGVLPLTAATVRGERGRWANAGFAVGCLVLVVVSVRLNQTLGATDG